VVRGERQEIAVICWLTSRARRSWAPARACSRRSAQRRREWPVMTRLSGCCRKAAMATDCKGSGGLCTIVACRWARPGSSEPGARVASVTDGVHPVTSASPVAAGGVLGVARLPVSDNTQTSSPHPIPNSPVRKYPRDKWPLGARRPVPDGVIVGRVVGAHFGGVDGRDSRNGPRRATDGGHLDAHLGVTRCPPRLFEDELGRLVRIRVHAVAHRLQTIVPIQAL
jgi:hypothetical protein